MKEDFEEVQNFSLTSQKVQAFNQPQLEQDIDSFSVYHQKRYQLLLTRVVESLTINNPEMGQKRKNYLSIPEYIREGLKTIVPNFTLLCKQLDRHPQHVINFFNKQLGLQGYLSQKGYTINTLVKIRCIQGLIKKYVIEYVRCYVCNRINSKLQKDSKRFWILKCKDCKATRTVPRIPGAQKKYQEYQKSLTQKKQDKPKN